MPAQPDSPSPAEAPGQPTSSAEKASAWYRFFLLVLGILLILGSAWLLPAGDFQLLPPAGFQWLIALLIFPFIVITSAFPLVVLGERISLAPVLTLGLSALSFVALGIASPAAAGVAGSGAILLGGLVSFGIGRLRPGSVRPGRPSIGFSGITLQIGALNSALALAFFAFVRSVQVTTQTGWGQTWTFMLVFALAHSLILVIDAILRRTIPSQSTGRMLAGLGGFELVPLPLIGMVITGYPGALAAVLLGSLACLFAVLLNRLADNRAALERHSQELAVLSQVSQSLHSTDSLEDLLAGIHQHVSQSLGVENFYVALFDGEREKIWYPLAVKSGQRVHWDARSLTDRLTDRVIRSQAPILLPRLAGEELVRIGLPPSQDAPSAWMGVPLTGSQGLMGCLAVFSFSSQAVFTRHDLEWLTTLAGQASVAIESILQTSRLFEEAQARELFTAALVHDLRSPASAVLGALDVMVESQRQGEARDDYLQAQAVSVARHAAQRLINLIDSLMDIARAQSGNLELSLAALDLRKQVLSVLADFYPQANEYGIILRTEMPEDLPRALMDASKILRVLANLVDNAVKFTPAGGQVTVRAGLHSPGLLAVAVCDSGPGIPEEYWEKVFERFSQVPGLQGRRGGSGLGLTFCRLVVEAMGGQIWVEANPGGGSIFVFTLPVAAGSDS